jgi:DNA-binding NtrC family response regulator
MNGQIPVETTPESHFAATVISHGDKFLPAQTSETDYLPDTVIRDSKNCETQDFQEAEEYHEVESIPQPVSLEDMEKQMIIRTLEKYRGKRKSAAEELKISERTLYRKIKEYGIND